MKTDPGEFRLLVSRHQQATILDPSEKWGDRANPCSKHWTGRVGESQLSRTELGWENLNFTCSSGWTRLAFQKKKKNPGRGGADLREAPTFLRILSPGALPGLHSEDWRKVSRFRWREGESRHFEIHQSGLVLQGLPSGQVSAADPELLGFYQSPAEGKYPGIAPSSLPSPPYRPVLKGHVCTGNSCFCHTLGQSSLWTTSFKTLKNVF